MKYPNNSAELQIVASCSIAEGEEVLHYTFCNVSHMWLQVFLCYIEDKTCECSARRAELREFYLFDCACTRCVEDETAGSPTVPNSTEGKDLQSPDANPEVDQALKLFSHIDSGRSELALKLLPQVPVSLPLPWILAWAHTAIL